MRKSDYEFLTHCLREGDAQGVRHILFENDLRVRDVVILRGVASGLTLDYLGHSADGSVKVYPRLATEKTLNRLHKIENKLDEINSFFDKQEDIKNAHVGR